MRKLFNLRLLHVVLLASCWGCIAAGEQQSSADQLERFKTTDFGSFLGTTNVIFRKDNLGGVIFKMRPGYVTGGTLQSGHRQVGIALYGSHEAAISAVEWRRKDVANLIERGPKERNGVADWWFGESQALLCIVQGGMVFEVCDLDRSYSAVEHELWATATKFLKTAESGRRD